MRGYVGAGATARVWKSESKWQESVFPFHHVRSRDQSLGHLTLSHLPALAAVHRVRRT